ncbi:hypothetical protein D3C80_2116040 [compost metagenome]
MLIVSSARDGSKPAIKIAGFIMSSYTRVKWSISYPDWLDIGIITKHFGFVIPVAFDVVLSDIFFSYIALLMYG